MAGNVPVAGSIAAELLKADPEDPDALLAMSTVYLAQRAWDEAYRASRTAFRYTDIDVNRYHAARIAATAAVAQEKVIPAQYWLRRAGDTATTPVQRRQVERLFSHLRAETPWRYKFHFSAAQSSNVNGGSETLVSTVDGDTGFIPLTLPDEMLALSGTIVQSGVELSYRLDQDATSQTALVGDIFLKRVILSDEAKASAPGFDAALLGNTILSFGVAHSRILGEDRKAFLRFTGLVRSALVDGERDYTAGVLNTVYTRQTGERVRLTLSGSVEARDYSNGNNGVVATAGAGLSYSFPNGNRVAGSVSTTSYGASLDIYDNTSVVGKVTFTLGKPVLGGVEMSTGLGASFADYPDYAEFFLTSPDGRQDESLFWDLQATFTQIEYAGFSPILRLRRTLTESNFDRFDTSGWSVSMGITSNF